MLRGDYLIQRADLFQQLATEYSIRPMPTARVEIDRHGDCHRLLANEKNIREVIAFPMNQKATARECGGFKLETTINYLV